MTYNVGWWPDSIGYVELAHEYLDKIAALIGGEVRETPNPAQWYVALKGTKQYPSAMALLTRQDEWQGLIAEYIKLTAALAQTGSV